jgi:hypothetical protein
VIEAYKMSILTLRNHLYKAIRPSSGFTVDEAPTSSALLLCVLKLKAENTSKGKCLTEVTFALI